MRLPAGFQGDAWVNALKKPVEGMLNSEKVDYEKAVSSGSPPYDSSKQRRRKARVEGDVGLQWETSGAQGRCRTGTMSDSQICVWKAGDTAGAGKGRRGRERGVGDAGAVRRWRRGDRGQPGWRLPRRLLHFREVHCHPLSAGYVGVLCAREPHKSLKIDFSICICMVSSPLSSRVLAAQPA